MADRMWAIEVAATPDQRSLRVQLLFLYDLPDGQEIKNVKGDTLILQPQTRMNPLVKEIHSQLDIFTAAELVRMDSGNILLATDGIVAPGTAITPATRARAWAFQAKHKTAFIQGLRDKHHFMGVEVVRP